MTGHVASIGIIGAGKIATDVHIPVLRAMKEARIAWVADREPARAESVARANRITSAGLGEGPQGLPPVDVVLLAIPLPPRAAYFDHFSKGSVVVLAEKPLGLSAVEHQVLMDSFGPWRLAVGYQRRTYAANRLLRRLVESAAFGPLRTIRVSEGGRTTRAADFSVYQDESVSAGGGLILNLGCHSLDIALWITGAKSWNVLRKSIVWDGGTDRRAQARIDLLGSSFCETVKLDWTVSWIDHQDNRMEFVFDGCILSAAIAPSRTVTVLDTNRKVLGVLDAAEDGGAVNMDQAFYLEWQDVISAVAEQRPSGFAAATSLRTAQLMDCPSSDNLRPLAA